MKKQLFMKAFKAIVVLVLFVGAVSSVSAQQLVPAKKAALMLEFKVNQFGVTPSSNLKVTGTQPLTSTQMVEVLRPAFYRGVLGKVKAGTAVDASIDAVYTAFQGRNQSWTAAGNTLRQEVIDYLTKTY